MARVNSKKSLIKAEQVSAIVTVLLVGVLVGGVVLAKGKPGPGGGGSSNLVYLSPSGGNYQVGATISVAVRENSGTNPVNAAQAGFSYSTSQLQFISVDGSASPFTSDLSPTQVPGSISLTRALFSGSVTGDQLVANVNFMVVGPGRTSLAMNAACNPSAPTATCTALSSGGSLLTITTAGASYKL